MLKELKIRGFKSLGEIKLNFTPMNVLIGANGAGKYNLIEVFRWLKASANYIIATTRIRFTFSYHTR